MFSRSRLLLAAVLVLGAVGIGAALRLPMPGARLEDRQPAADLKIEILPSLDGASGWLNGDRHAVDSLRGHPVLLALWSDTDPRCLEALSRLESWHAAYSRYGVRVLGVYAPEFLFGVDSMVPVRIARRYGLSFPIALDPSYQVRSRLGPAIASRGVVFADRAGQALLVADLDHLDDVDRAIRKQVRTLHPELDFPEAGTPAARSTSSRSLSFVYLGAGRVETGPLANVASGRVLAFTTQFRFQEEGKEHVPYPVGRWVPTAEGLIADRGGAADFVAIRDAGERVWAVLSPQPAASSRVWILADESWLPAPERGADVRADGRGATYVDVGEPRLYEIARPGRSRVLRFSPQEPGLTIHAFAFGREPVAAP